MQSQPVPTWCQLSTPQSDPAEAGNTADACPSMVGNSSMAMNLMLCTVQIQVQGKGAV